MNNTDFLKRLPSIYSQLTARGMQKMVIHKDKGDWIQRKDKTLAKLSAGLIIEVGELIAALEKKDIELVGAECGDLLNYLAMIYEKAEWEFAKELE